MHRKENEDKEHKGGEECGNVEKTSSYTHQPTHTHAAWKMIVDEIYRYKFLLIPEERKQTLFHTLIHIHTLAHTHNHYTTQRKRMRPYTVAFISKILSSCHAHALTFTIRRKSKDCMPPACECVHVCVCVVCGYIEYREECLYLYVALLNACKHTHRST